MFAPLSSSSYHPPLPTSSWLSRGEVRRSSLTQSLSQSPTNLNRQLTARHEFVTRSRSSSDRLSPAQADRFDFDSGMLDDPLQPQVSSAPPSPAASSILHPSAYIHTHHPRRTSLTPLTLNLISPAPPSTYLQQEVRRQSHQMSSAIPIYGYSSARRRSLTPSIATLAEASPTKLAATGAISRMGGPSPQYLPDEDRLGSSSRLGTRPSVSEGNLGEAAPPVFGSRAIPASFESVDARRSSQPTINLQGPAARSPLTTGSRTPVQMDPQEEATLTRALPIVGTNYRFGKPAGTLAAGPSTPTRYSPTAVTGNSPLSASTSSSEVAEAERQRIAFMASTYGKVPRGSIGGISDRRMSAIRTASCADQPSAIGNEGPRRGSLGFPGHAALGTSGTILTESVGPRNDERRGSLPIAIPSPRGTHRTVPSTDSSHHLPTSDEEASENEHETEDHIQVSCDIGPAGSISLLTKGSFHQIAEHEQQRPSCAEEGEESLTANDRRSRRQLNRPLPPLLPLSDPGPRILPSTLALHRANHLLQYRNLASEPMPPPLPTSLHPPQPVDVSDFDIDFILAGSHEVEPTTSVPDLRSRQQSQSSPRQLDRRNTLGLPDTLKLGPGGEDEDTFAKFVGEFDNEYDDRRDDWTFRACPPTVREKSSNREGNVAKWVSEGAGLYLIDPSGKVESEQSGQVLFITRVQPREFEIEVIRSPSVLSDINLLPVNSCFVLAPKQVHNELGGVKTLSRSRSISRSEGGHVQREQALPAHEARSLPTGSALKRLLSPGIANMPLPPIRRDMTDMTATSEPDMDLSLARRHLVKYQRHAKSLQSSPAPEDSMALPSGSAKDKKKDRPSIGYKIKRSWLAGLNRSSFTGQDEKFERQREKQAEKMQAHSWSAGSSGSSAWSAGSASSSVYPHGDPSQSASKSLLLEGTYQPPWLLLAEGNPKDKSGGKKHDGAGVRPSRESDDGGLSGGHSFADEASGALGFKHGKAWESVPNDAVAMVLPLDPPDGDTTAADRRATSQPRPSSEGLATFFTDAPARSLLVYYVPFVSRDDVETRPTGSRKFSANKLLRRTSKDKMRPKSFGDAERLADEQDATAQTALALQALPFKSFRIVACVVTPEDLKSEPDLPAWDSLAVTGSDPKNGSAEAAASPIQDDQALGTTSEDTSQNRFPTVIAVCHSRSQGVEFVLEGLDRLGLCKRSGASPWGIMGYEEWRGGGLNDTGRSLLDVLWAGCVCALGLHGGGGKLGSSLQR